MRNPFEKNEGPDIKIEGPGTDQEKLADLKLWREQLKAGMIDGSPGRPDGALLQEVEAKIKELEEKTY